MPGGKKNQRQCVACQHLIYVACKKCPHCKAQQPYKKRLIEARTNFAAQKSEYVKNIKKNCNQTHVLESSFKVVSGAY